jgi:hypothetical protein
LVIPDSDCLLVKDVGGDKAPSRPFPFRPAPLRPDQPSARRRAVTASATVSA